jgi:DNA-binding response OmpR family regulator
MTRILCLDADRDIVNLLSLILKRSGYEVFSTTDSREALEILRHQSIDLFMQDLLRPGIGGKLMCQMIRDDENLRQIPIVIASDYIEGGKRMVAEGYADAFVSKPVGPIELLDTVEEVLRKHSIPLAPEEARARVRNLSRRHGKAKP